MRLALSLPVALALALALTLAPSSPVQGMNINSLSALIDLFDDGGVATLTANINTGGETIDVGLFETVILEGNVKYRTINGNGRASGLV